MAEQNVYCRWKRQILKRHPNDNWIILIHEAAPLGGDTWKDVQIPTCIPEATASDCWNGVWLDAPEHETATIKAAATLEALREIAREAGHPPELLATDGTSPVTGFDRGIRAVLLRDREHNLHLFLSFSGLGGKYIGIVGLGSAGGKIAVTLARMGARNFYLVDHDIFLPENIVRGALDWQAVGEHNV